MDSKGIRSIAALAVFALCMLGFYALSAPLEGHMEQDAQDNSIQRRQEELNQHRERLSKAERSMEDAQQQIASLRREISAMKNATNQGKKYQTVKVRNEFDRKRILITGGAGFVGSHLTDVLMKEGHEVTVMDNFFTGRRKNVEHWIGHPNFELIKHDVVEPYMMEVDEIYHLASPASPPHYMYNPVKTIKTNTVGTLNMLGLAKRTGARVLLASTSEVYGNPEIHPQVETYFGNVNPNGPRACYDEGKRIAETMCFAYAKQSDVEVRVARIFNTFGPRMHMGDGRVVSNFIIQALQDQPITIYGKGLQTRSFQYVSDLVAGLIALMNGDHPGPMNLGNPDEFTMLDFAKYIRELTDSKSEIVHKPATQDDPQKRRPDITRAKTNLGWSPQVSVKDGLAKTIAYFRDELSRPSVHDKNGHGVGGPYGAEINLPYINEETEE